MTTSNDAWARPGRVLVALAVAALALTVASPSTPSAQAATVNPQANEALVVSAYYDFLGRYPSTSETTTWTNYLNGGGHIDPLLTQLAHSSEWISHIVTDFYLGTIGRSPDAGGLDYWTQQLATGKMSVAQVAALFYASDEYYRVLGGGTDRSWVSDLYPKLLLRTPDSDGVTYWIGQIARVGRGSVASNFYQSSESRRTRVTQLYGELLSRQPDTSGRDYWTAVIQREGDISLATSLASSLEYATTAIQRFGAGRNTPKPLTGVTAIANYSGSRCAIANGSAYCWGYNTYGQVGNGTTDTVSVPYRLPLSNVTKIARGGDTTCAIASGNVYCWGSNSAGQIGNGSYGGSAKVLTPYKTSITNATDIVVNNGHDYANACAVAAGSVWCWGSNTYGQIGDGTSARALTPKRVAVANVTSISMPDTTVCVVAGGLGYCWGSNSNGEVGNGTTSTVRSPSKLPLAGVSSIATSDAGTTCAVASGSGYCWGYNYYGQVGNNDTTGRRVTSPYRVSLSSVTRVMPGDTSCAIAGGLAYCWGYNSNGQVGNGQKTTSVWIPYRLPLNNVSQLSSDHFVTCAIAAGSGYCWGYNYHLHVGNGGDGSYVLSPYRLAINGVSSLVGSGQTGPASFRWSTCAVAGGKGYCWGDNEYGQLGRGRVGGRIGVPLRF